MCSLPQPNLKGAVYDYTLKHTHIHAFFFCAVSVNINHQYFKFPLVSQKSVSAIQWGDVLLKSYFINITLMSLQSAGEPLLINF